MLNSMIRKCSWCNTDSGLLVLRIGVAAIFITTGWVKLSDMSGTVGFFASLGFAPFWAYLVTGVELVGGLMVLFGVQARVAAAFLAVVMLVATYELLTKPHM